MKNPYSLVFGKEPSSIIPRDMQIDEIISSFCADNPDYQVCMITGVRGTGKTVLLNMVAEELREQSEWISVALNPDRNLLVALAAALQDKDKRGKFLSGTHLSISALGVGVGISSQPPIIDVANELDKLLHKLTRSGKKLLVTIDEVVSNQNVREFVSQFQIYMSNNYNVFLLMTGLYENIYELQNEKTLTFLYRAPRIMLKPLSLPMIKDNYQKNLQLSDADALAMAKLTEGYSFAFQVLGYLCFKRQATYGEVIPEYDSLLGDFVYEKIWSELSSTDQKVAEAIARSENSKIEDIRKVIAMPSNKFSMYRNRMLRRGIVEASAYGHLRFALPRFKEFVLNNL